MVLKYKVITLPKVDKDLDEIYRYIANESGGNYFAIRTAKKIREKILSLNVFPKGAPIDEFGYRVVKVKKYKIYYLVDDKKREVLIVRILHSARKGSI